LAGGCTVDSAGLGQWPAEGFCEYSYESSGSGARELVYSVKHDKVNIFKAEKVLFKTARRTLPLQDPNVSILDYVVE
jgi:hypothetical protein